MEIDDILPEYFYKFTTTDRALQILQERELWFSRAKDFNDPFDCNIGLLNFEPNESDITAIINDKVAGNRKLRRAEIQKNKRNAYRIWNQFSEQIEESFNNSGICCFSSVPDNILLWAHYANNHKGVCLKFKSDISEIGTMTAKVTYQKHFEKMPFFSEKESAIYHLIFTKSKDWKYEKEIRLFRMLDYGQTKFSIEYLTEIIFGCRTKKG